MQVTIKKTKSDPFLAYSGHIRTLSEFDICKTPLNKTHRKKTLITVTSCYEVDFRR